MEFSSPHYPHEDGVTGLECLGILFRIFAAALHICKPSPPSATRGRAAPSCQGTHLSFISVLGGGSDTRHKAHTMNLVRNVQLPGLTQRFTVLRDIRGRVLGSVQGGTNNCVRQGAKESCQICTSYEQFELGNFGVA